MMSKTAPTGTPTYRIFHLNDRGGIARAEILDAASDDEALQRLEGMKPLYAIELWERARFIRKVSPVRDDSA